MTEAKTVSTFTKLSSNFFMGSTSNRDLGRQGFPALPPMDKP